MKLIAAFLALVLLCGCASDSVEDVLRVPSLPVEFEELNDEISRLKGTGLELVAPISGNNRQSVQLADLDGDGIDEGIAFFKEASNIYAYIFKKQKSGYDVCAEITGTGNSIASVTFADLIGDGDNQMIVGWSVVDSDARAVAVYDMTEDGVRKLCEIACLHHMVTDLDSDGVSDLSVIYTDPADSVQKLALYAYLEGGILFRASAPLTQSEEKIQRIRAANATYTSPAVFVERGFNKIGIITDVIIYKNNRLLNITYSDTTQKSDATARGSAMFCEDIDQDSNLEIPMAQSVMNYKGMADGELLRGVLWYGFDDLYNMVEKAFTIGSVSDNWTLMLPMEWRERVTATSRKNGNDEVITIYNTVDGEPQEKLFSIRAFYGDDRETRAASFEEITARTNAIYAADINAKTFAGYDITVQMIRDRFYFRQSEWTSGEVVY